MKHFVYREPRLIFNRTVYDRGGVGPNIVDEWTSSDLGLSLGPNPGVSWTK